MLKYIQRIFKFSNIVIGIIFLLVFIFSIAPEKFITDNDRFKLISILLTLIAIEFFISKITYLQDIFEKVSLLCDSYIGNRGINFIKANELDRIEKIIKDGFNEVVIVGISLGAVVKIISHIEDKIEDGCVIKLLAVDPNGESLISSAEMSNVPKESRKNIVQTNLEHLKFAFKNHIESKKVIIKVIDTVLPIGIVGIDIENDKGKMVIQHYLYHESSARSPNIVLFPKVDEFWYNTYKDQWRKLWDNGVIYD